MTSKIFLALCEQEGLPAPEAEYRFHPTRKWRFDWAFKYHQVAVEVEGGAFSGGRHTRGVGFVKDMEKYNTAASMGWLVLRVQPKELCSKSTFELIRTTLAVPIAPRQ